MTSPTKKTDTSPSTTGDKAEAKKADQASKTEAQTDFARLGVNTDLSDFVEYGGYREPDSEDWVPNPHFQYGTLDTTDTAGAAHQNVREISPVFDQGRAQALALAARALDPEDTDVPESLVVLPEEPLTNEEAKRQLADRVEALKKDKIVLGGPTTEQKAAATDADGNVAEAPADDDAADKKTSAK
jgi:hypothetical protein